MASRPGADSCELKINAAQAARARPTQTASDVTERRLRLLSAGPCRPRPCILSAKVVVTTIMSIIKLFVGAVIESSVKL